MDRELFPAAVGGLELRAHRSDTGVWIWCVTVRQDTPRERVWIQLALGTARTRYEAWADMAQVLYENLTDLDEELL